MTKFTKWKKWQKLIQGLYPNHVHISRPWQKHVQKFYKDRYKIVWGVALTRYPLSLDFHRIWGEKMTKVHKVEKVTKINSRIISKPYAYLQTMAKTCTKFQKDQYKIVWGAALTRYPLSQHFHRIWGQKMTVRKVEKVTKINARIISKHYAHFQTMEKTCAKFQKDWYKIVWRVALTRYPLSIHWGRKMTKFTKWKKW